MAPYHSLFPQFLAGKVGHGVRHFFLTTRQIVVALLYTVFLLLLAGCGGSRQERIPPLPHDMPVDPPAGAAMLTANTYAGDALSAILLQRVGSGSGILTATMVNMEDMDASSPFGRTAMQQIGSRVAQHGFKVIEVRLTNEMRMELKNGEFMLSRDTARLLARDHDAHAVLVGVYSRSATRVFISTRVIRLVDNAVIAAYEYYLPLSNDAGYLLGNSLNSPDGGKSADALWSQYARRGQAFAGKGSHPPKGDGPMPYAPEEQPQATMRTGNAAVVPTSGGAATPFISNKEAPSGGLYIDPNAKPAPLGTGTQQR
jgi:TolB-like protein